MCRVLEDQLRQETEFSQQRAEELQQVVAKLETQGAARDKDDKMIMATLDRQQERMGDWEEWLEQLERRMDLWGYDDDDSDHPYPNRVPKEELMDELLWVAPSLLCGETPWPSQVEFNNHVLAIDEDESCPVCKAKGWLGPCETGEVGLRHLPTCTWCPPCPVCGVSAQHPRGRRYHEPGCPKDQPQLGRAAVDAHEDHQFEPPRRMCRECFPLTLPDGSVRHMLGCSKRTLEPQNTPDSAVNNGH